MNKVLNAIAEALTMTAEALREAAATPQPVAVEPIAEAENVAEIETVTDVTEDIPAEELPAEKMPKDDFNERLKKAMEILKGAK